MSKKFVQVAGKTPSMHTNCKHALIFLHVEHYGFFNSNGKCLYQCI